MEGSIEVYATIDSSKRYILGESLILQAFYLKVWHGNKLITLTYSKDYQKLRDKAQELRVKWKQ